MAPVPTRTALSWSWVVPAGLLLAVAVALIIVGSTLEAGPLSPVFFPARPIPSVTPSTSTSTTTTLASLPVEDGRAEGVTVADVAAYDPFGDNTEQPSRDKGPDKLVDGNVDTGWRTERYLDPLSLQKLGVGITFAIKGTPSWFEAADISRGMHYTLYWSTEIQPKENFQKWGRVAAGISDGGNLLVQLPARSDGVWLLWFTELPRQSDGFYGGIAEVRFRS
jgi:hypothetical protein